MLKLEKKHKNKNSKQFWFLVSVWFWPVLMFLIFFVYANLQSFGLAFIQIDDWGNFQRFIGFENIKSVFSDLFSSKNDILHIAILNNIKLYIVSLVISMPLYMIFSYYIFKKRPFSKTFRTLAMVPAMVSTFVFALLFKKVVETVIPNLMAKFFGIENFPQLLTNEKYSFGVIVFYSIWLSFGTSLLVYPNAMNSIDVGILESAKIDGVNNFQEMTKIIIPLILPTVSTFMITGIATIFVASGPIFEFYYDSAPPEVYTLGYYMYLKTMSNLNSMSAYSYLSALGLVLSLFSLPLTFGMKILFEKLDPMADRVGGKHANL